MNLQNIFEAIEVYLSARGELDSHESSFTVREHEVDSTRADVAQALNEYINRLAADVETLKQSLSENIYKLNKLRAEQARLQARGEWARDDLSKLLQTLAELERKEL